jgi:hypothetical protein
VIQKNNLSYNASGLGEGYVYPFINYGNSQNIGTLSYVYDMYPSVYVKTIMDKLFDYAGYSYTSSFFNTNYFKSLIIPFTNDKLQYNPEQLSALTTTVGVLNTNPEPSPQLSNSFYAYESNAGVTGWRQTSPVLKLGTTYDSLSVSNFFPLEKETGAVAGITMQDPLTAFTNSIYTVQTPGFYKIDFQMSFIMKYIEKNGNSIEHDGGDFLYGVSIIRIKANGNYQMLAQGPYPFNFSSTFTPSTGVHSSPWYDTETEMNIGLNINSVYLEAGDTLRIRFYIDYNSEISWNGFSNNNKIYALALIKNNTDGVANYFNVQPASNTITNPNVAVEMIQALPVMKMRDFFLSIVKMFNLIVADNPNKEGDIIIEPKDDFYNSRKKVKDWTPLLDESRDLIQTPMSELDVRRYEFKYTEDDDYYNKQYSNETNDIYGNFELDFLNEFSNEIKEIKIGFSPSPGTNNFIPGRVAPFYADIEGTTTMKPKKIKPRILFYGGRKSGPYQLRNTPASTTGATYTSYPYCGMWDDPYSPQYDLGWGKTQKIYWNAQLYPNNNLTQMWYSSTLQELEDVNSKLVEGFFYLTPSEIKDFDFRDIIFLNNGYYRVNKISDYDPTSVDKTTKVELYKILTVDFFPLLNESLPQTGFGCPTDIISKKTKTGFIYVSQSGKELGPDCCKLVGGIWSGGVCKVPNAIGGGVGVGNPVSKPATGFVGGTKPVKPSSGVGGKLIKKPTGAYNNSPVFQDRPIEQNKNNQSINSPDSVVLGFGGYVPANSKNTILIGDNLSVDDGIENAIVIGNDAPAKVSNSLTVGDLLITTDGLQWANPYIIDAGLNTVMNDAKTNFIDVIDGGLNSVRNLGGDSKLRPIIDGSEPPA